jgi:hypothetical protein
MIKRWKSDPFRPKYFILGFRLCRDEGCVSCGRPIDINPETGLSWHECSPKHIAARESASVRFEEPRMNVQPFSERLKYGFWLLGLAYDDDGEDYDLR